MKQALPHHRNNNLISSREILIMNLLKTRFTMKRITNLSIIAGLSVLATAACTKTEKVAETVQGGDTDR